VSLATLKILGLLSRFARWRRIRLMNETQLLSIFFLLGKSPKELDFLEEDWDDEYLEVTGLSWDEFLELRNQGLWELNTRAIDMFTESFSSFKGFREVKEVFESISADSEDWNDFIEFIVSSDDFEELWSDSWLTRYDMESSLEEFSANDSNSVKKIEALKRQLELWFDSKERDRFQAKLLRQLKPLTEALENLSKGPLRK
jgi:hypothetical protein